MSDEIKLTCSQPEYDCPKCGVVFGSIESNVEGAEGMWCMKCALRLLDKHVPRVTKHD